MVDFPEPVGRAQVFYVGHPEPITLSRNIPGVRNITNKGAFMPPELGEMIGLFSALGFTDTSPITVKGQKVVPRDFLVALMSAQPSVEVPPEERLSAVLVEVAGTKNGLDVTYKYSVAGNMGPGTGIAASIGAQMLGRREIKAKGALAPEACIDPEKFLAELAKRGITLTETTITTKKN